MTYQQSIDDYKKSLIKNVSKYPELSTLFTNKNLRKITSINSIKDFQLNDLLIFLALDNPKIENVENLLASIKKINGYESILKSLKDNLFGKEFWSTIAEIEAAKNLISKNNTIAFPKSSNPCYDIIIDNQYYASVKTIEDIDPVFKFARLSILGRSMLDIFYRSKLWHISILEKISHDYFYEFKKKKNIPEIIENSLDEIKTNKSNTYTYDNEYITIEYDITRNKNPYPIISYGFAEAKQLDSKNHFVYLLQTYQKILDLSHREYLKFKDQGFNDEVISNSRLMIFPNTGLYFPLFDEYIIETCNKLINIFDLDTFFKVDVII